jgi:hypothetical protein
MMIPAALASSILCVLASIHLYWAAGGTAGKSAAVPSQNGKPIFSPSAMATAMVGIALFGVAIIVMVTAFGLRGHTFVMPLRIGTSLIGLAFAGRAIGDFRYVGFCKRVRDSAFAYRDTYVYSPLCLVLALLIGAVAFTYTNGHSHP